MIFYYFNVTHEMYYAMFCVKITCRGKSHLTPPPTPGAPMLRGEQSAAASGAIVK